MTRFLQALREHGIDAPKGDIGSDRMHRWGKDKRFWARRFNGGYVFGDFVENLSTHVFDRDDYTKSELRALRASMEKARKETEEEQRKINDEASVRANKIWNKSKLLSSHPYLAEKRIQSHGLKENNGEMLVPAYDENGKMWSLQRIFEITKKEGKKEFTKQFLPGSKAKGHFFIIGDIETSDLIYICEGYATGAAIYECTSTSVVVAFSSGSLRSVAEKIRAKYSKKIVICADNDQFHESGSNPGLRCAKEAAKAIGSSVVKPEFKDISKKPTDFNDLLRQEGIEAVKVALQNTVTPGIPLGFHLTNDGLFYSSEKGKELNRISNYIKVLAFTKNEKQIARLVEFRDYNDNLLKTVLHPKMFSKGGDEVRIHLNALGFAYSWNAIAKSKLVEYLSDSIPDKEVIVANQTGFFGNTHVCSVYIRPDQIIGDTHVGETAAEIILDELINDKAFATKESVADWMNNIAKYCENNSRLTFVVSAAFASVLLHVCEISNVGFHLYGKSASGKTTCLNVAASVFGNSKFVVSWKTTDNSLENTAYRRNDALLILDELSEIPSDKAGNVAYMLANGKGKSRMDKNCKSRDVLEWRLVFLSSGEIDLSAHMAEANKTSKAGQKVRLLNIPAVVDENSAGIFEDLHGFKDGAEFSNCLTENAKQYYGSASVEFTKLVIKNMKAVKFQYKQEYQHIKSKHLPDKSEGQDMRVFEKFMFIGFAGELATKYGITGWKEGDSYNAALKCFHAWLEEKGGVGDDENKQILEQAKAFFELHGCSRFYDVNGLEGQKVINMAGYKDSYKDAVKFYVFPSAFQNEICKGFNRKTVIQLLIKYGFLEQNANGEYRQQKHIAHHGNKKVYVISGKILS